MTERLYLTITNKPLSVAQIEQIPAVHVIVSTIETEQQLVQMMQEASRMLEAEA